MFLEPQPSMPIPVTLLLFALLGLARSTSLCAQTSPPSQASTLSFAELKTKINGDNRNNPVVSIRSAEEALQKLASEPDPGLEIWFLTGLVRDLRMISAFPKAEAYLEQGRKVVARSGDLRSHFLLEIEGAALLTATDRHEASKQLLDEILPALTSYRSTNLQDREIGLALAMGYRIRGAVTQILGLYTEAIGAYQKAQKLGEELRDVRGQVIVLNRMGTLYAIIDRPKEAVASHRQAIQMAEKISDLALQAVCHLDLANTYTFENNLDAQMAALSRALDLARKADAINIQITGLVNLADVSLRKQDYKATLQYSDEAQKLLGIRMDPGILAVCQVNRGIALNRLGNNSEGLKTLQEGLEHFKTTHAKSDIAEVTGNLAEEYAFAGDYRRAFETACEFKTLSDELKRSDDQKHIAAASAAFESDKKQIQIEALQREQRNQLRLKMLWIALGVLGFSVAGVLVISRRKLQQVNDALTALNNQNLDLITQLQSALSEVQTLQGLIPICAHCKKIRDDEGYWSQMETYIQSRTGALFSHGICPDCAKVLQAELEQWRAERS